MPNATTTTSHLALSGRLVVVTRAEQTGGPLTASLASHGAQVLHWPTIRIAQPKDAAPLTKALAHLETFDWIVFTSANAVHAVVSMVATPPAKLLIAAIGPATSTALTRANWPIHAQADQASALSMTQKLAQDHALRGKRILFPASAIAKPTVRVQLSAVGAEVTQVTAYATVPAPLDTAPIRAAITTGTIEAVTFASPSAVRFLHHAIGDELWAALFAQAAAVAIGETTAEALAVFETEAAATAAPSTLVGLATAVVDALTANAPPDTRKALKEVTR